MTQQTLGLVVFDCIAQGHLFEGSKQKSARLNLHRVGWQHGLALLPALVRVPLYVALARKVGAILEPFREVLQELPSTAISALSHRCIYRPVKRHHPFG